MFLCRVSKVIGWVAEKFVCGTFTRKLIGRMFRASQVKLSGDSSGTNVEKTSICNLVGCKLPTSMVSKTVDSCLNQFDAASHAPLDGPSALTRKSWSSFEWEDDPHRQNSPASEIRPH